MVEEVGFVTAYCFKYSPRPHTPALKLGDDVSEELKSERLERLFAVVDALQLRHLQSLAGTRSRVLIEGPSKIGRGRFTGRSERHEIVHVDAPDGVDLTGMMLDVRISHANTRSLAGEIIGDLPQAALPPVVASRKKTTLRLPVVGP